MRLRNKIALITGGSTGIGLATARRFIAEGANVVITGRRRDALNSATNSLGKNILAVRSDVVDLDERNRLFDKIAREFGRLDILFANAGIARHASVAEASEAMFAETMQINVTGVFLTVQAALPFMGKGSSIVLNGSVSATVGSPGAGFYAASKGAIRSMSRAMASELAPRGIRVNVVVPGLIRTPIWEQATTPASDERDTRLQQGVPLDRWGDSDEVANAVLFLASDEASYVHGASLSWMAAFLDAPTGRQDTGTEEI